MYSDESSVPAERLVLLWRICTNRSAGTKYNTTIYCYSRNVPLGH